MEVSLEEPTMASPGIDVNGCKKCELIGYEELPEWLKDNEFIHGHYRCEWPMRETVVSIFSIHNETLNVWTHLIGFVMFMCLTILTAMVVPVDQIGSSIEIASSMKKGFELGHMVEMANMTGGRVTRPDGHAAVAACFLLSPASAGWPEDDEQMQMQIYASSSCCPPNRSSSHHAIQNSGTARPTDDKLALAMPSAQPITRWPLFAFLCGAMLCLLTSSICHLILCHSEQVAYITLRLDYVGIAALIVTSFYPLVYYSFLCEPYHRRLYMCFITAFGAATITVSLIPAFQAPEFRSARAALFSCMGVSGLVPIVHKLMLFHHRPEAVVSTCYEALMGALYGIGVTIYAARIPERWMPGRFDIVGHSHQLFHLFVIAGAYTHYLGGLEYLKWRDTEKCW